MTARINLKRCVVVLWAVVGAAGCAKVIDDVPRREVTAAPPATEPVPGSLEAPATAPVLQLPPSASTAEPSSPVVEPPAVAAETPTEPPVVATQTSAEPPAEAAEAPAEQPAVAAESPAEREDAFAPSVAQSAPADALDLASLATRLRKTKAINLRTKLAVKNESDDLVKRFRAYHAEHGTATLAELRRSYDALFRKLHALLESADPPLARDIDRSRAAIWALLADPSEFGAASARAPGRRTPRA